MSVVTKEIMRHDQIPDLLEREGQLDFLTSRTIPILPWVTGRKHSCLLQQGRFREELIWGRRPGTQFCCCDVGDTFIHPGMDSAYVRLVFKERYQDCK